MWLGLSPHEGNPWVLTTHQSLRIFASFAALLDHSALLGLAEHLGHRERFATDHSYCGLDYPLNEESEAGKLEQSDAAWDYMLAAPGLDGCAGAEILVKRSRFRGGQLKQDIKRYAKTLVDAA